MRSLLLKNLIYKQLKTRQCNTLKPGIEGTVNLTGSQNTHAFSQRNVLSWREGLFYFEEAELNEIGRVLQRWFGVKSTIDDPLLNKKLFRGVLDKNQSLQFFLEDLKAISKITGYLDKDGVLHFK